MMMFKSVEAFQQFSTQQMEAAAASATALTNGMQQIFAETTALSKKTVETGTDALQSLISSPSVDRAFQVQIEFAKTALDSMVAGSSRLGSIVSATAQDMVRPLEGAFQRAQAAARPATTA
jgi:hypothetical protein